MSDSLSSLQSINLRKSNSRPDLIENIISLNDQCHLNNIKVKFAWCPAHVDLPGNELADRAAKDGLKGSVGENIPLAITEIYSVIRSHKKLKMTKRLAEQQHKQPFTQQGISLRPPHCYSTNRMVDKCVTRLRLNNNLLSGSIGQYILGVSPICPKCSVRNTTEHFMLHCNVHREARTQLSNVIQGSGMQMSINDILFPSKALQTSSFKALETYLLDCQMTDKI